MNFYNPQPVDRGYFYHVEIYEEALLTYKQYLERDGSVCTSDPEDNTDYYSVSWYKCGKTSFAEKEWNDLVIRLRNHFKIFAKTMIQGTDNNDRYVYYYGSVFGVKGQVLKRSKFWIYHSATIQLDEQKFMSDLTRIGRWEKAQK